SPSKPPCRGPFFRASCRMATATVASSTYPCSKLKSLESFRDRRSMMLTYTAPLRDMRFVLHELHDSAGLAHLPGFEEITPDLLDTIVDDAARFISETL